MTRAAIQAGLVVTAMVAAFAASVAIVLRKVDGLPPVFVLHATLMISAWGVLLPAGGVLARYFKVTPRQNFPAEVDNLLWFNWHRALQYAGLALATVAFVAVLWETGGRFDTWHGRCGLLVMVFGWMQAVTTWFRGSKGGPTGLNADPADAATWRGDHYDMTRRRLLFEAWHKPAGWAVLVLAGVTMLLGIFLVGAPPWLLGLAGALQAAAVLGVIDGRLHARWVDTYHAIWGPDPMHPGNRRISAPLSRRRRSR